MSRAAERIVEMVRQLDREPAAPGLLPRQIVTAASVDAQTPSVGTLGPSTSTFLMSGATPVPTPALGSSMRCR